MARTYRLLVAIGVLLGCGFVVTYFPQFPPATMTTIAGLVGLMIDPTKDEPSGGGSK